jgi:putative zinc finger/helix-turn-helix YgiT family protein
MQERKIKPFPWMCPDCRQKTVWMVRKDYTMPSEDEGIKFDVVVRDADVPMCSRCGTCIITSDLSERITDEWRRRVGLLSPDEIRTKREALGMTQADLASAVRVPEATLIRWESGMQTQTRAMDLLLRLFLDSADVRRACVSGVAPSETTGFSGAAT